MPEKFICYYRVSTTKQGQSGLGLEAQKKTIKDYLRGSRSKIVGHYMEVESGAQNQRLELQKAIKDCRLKGARLVVAKLDRLSRDLHFITQLQNAGVPFVVAEMPQATELTIHIYAAMAQHERKIISERTKVALAQLKGTGKLGNPCFKKGEQIPGSGKTHSANHVRKKKADEFAKDMISVINSIKANKIISLRDIAATLNERGYETKSGGKWHANSVSRIMKRTEGLS